MSDPNANLSTETNSGDDFDHIPVLSIFWNDPPTDFYLFTRDTDDTKPLKTSNKSYKFDHYLKEYTNHEFFFFFA